MLVLVFVRCGVGRVWVEAGGVGGWEAWEGADTGTRVVCERGAKLVFGLWSPSFRCTGAPVDDACRHVTWQKQGRRAPCVLAKAPAGTIPPPCINFHLKVIRSPGRQCKALPHAESVWRNANAWHAWPCGQVVVARSATGGWEHQST